MRKILTGVAAAALATASVVGMSGAAYAIPDNNKQPVVYICDGVETEIFGTGRSAWLNGEQYLAVSLEFVGVFTPEGGGEPIEESNTKTWAGGPKVEDPDDLIECTAHIEETVPGVGTFVGDGTATAVRVH